MNFTAVLCFVSGWFNALNSLYRWFNASHSSVPQSGFQLVLLAFQAFRQLRWTGNCRDLLRFRATNCERSGVRFQWDDGSTPHTTFWIARDSDKSAER